MKWIAAAMSLLSLAAPLPAQEAAPAFHDRYGVLAERNIFLREQPPPRPAVSAEPAPEPPPPPPPPPIETRFILRGIVADGPAFRAYVHDQAGGTLVIVAVDEPVAGGRLVAIDLDGAVYENDQGQTRVAVGENLRGERPVTAPAPDPAPPSAPPGAEQPAEDAGGDEPAGEPGDESQNTPPQPANDGDLSIEERMRQRRMQEISRP